MGEMYPAMFNSPITELSSGINDVVTTIPLKDTNKLPPGPNLATIGLDENAETILYTGKSGNDLTGVTRGFQGAANSWDIDTPIGRMFTAYDYDTLRTNLSSHGDDYHSVNYATLDETGNVPVNQLGNIDTKLELHLTDPTEPEIGSIWIGVI